MAGTPDAIPRKCQSGGHLPVKEATQQLLEKAAHAIHAAEVLMKDDEIDFAAGRAYYAMFYLAEALLYAQGLRRFTKHGAVHAAFGTAYAKTGVLDPKFHRWLLDAFDKRIQGDYDAESSITSDDVAVMLAQAREFAQATQRYLAGTSTKTPPNA